MTRTLFALAAVALTAGAASAAPPTIGSVAPAVGQRGTEFTLMLSGAGLANPQESMLYNAGVVCTKLTAKGDNQVVATFKAASDCRLGLYPFRLRTPRGASEARTFLISPFPIVAEKEPNDNPKQAQHVPLNVSIAGVIEEAGVDYYAVTLKKGQRLAAEVEGVRLGGELTDTVLTVFGPNGELLATVDDTALFRQDPFVTVIASTDGVYRVQVRDTNYGGGENNRYVLHIGSFCRPAAIFPTSGQGGTEVAVKLIGDAAGDRTQRLKLPPAGVPFDFYPSDGGIAAPTPNPFRVSAFPNVMEVEPNDQPSQAGTAVPWPVAFNGIIEKPGDTDHFRFKATRGDVIDVTAYAFRIGSPLDTVMAVLDSAGELLAANDDDETHDSRVRVTIPAGGEYVVRVTDKRGQGGPRYIYRIELDRPKPGLTLFLPEPIRKSQERQVIAVPRSNRVMTYLAVRRDGFSGPVTITPGELPAGLHVAIPTVPADEYLMPVVFEADAGAPIGGKLVPFTGTGGETKTLVHGGFKQIVNLINGVGDLSIHSVGLSKLAVVVVEELPFSLNILPPSAPLVPDGTTDITLKVTRAKDFTEPLEVFFPALPPGVEAPTSVPVPADKTEVIVTLEVHPSAELGDWRLIAEARPARATPARRDPLAVGLGMAVGGRRAKRAAESLIPVASQPVALKVIEPVVKGRFSPVWGEQGKSVRVKCQLEAVAPQAGSLIATLEGLPPRATALPVELKGSAKEVEFQVTIDATTPPGEHWSLVCALTRSMGRHKVVQRVGRGGSLKVEAAGDVKTDSKGKPLSRLDALRQEQKKGESKKP
jgi:hypothetical protein